MATNINGGEGSGLWWESGINLDGLKKDAKEAENIIRNLSKLRVDGGGKLSVNRSSEAAIIKATADAKLKEAKARTENAKAAALEAKEIEKANKAKSWKTDPDYNKRVIAAGNNTASPTPVDNTANIKAINDEAVAIDNLSIGYKEQQKEKAALASQSKNVVTALSAESKEALSVSSAYERNADILGSLKVELAAVQAQMKGKEAGNKGLIAQEDGLKTRIEAVSKEMKLQRAVYEATEGSTKKLEEKLALLVHQYKNLSTVDKNSAFGKSLNKEITDLSVTVEKETGKIGKSAAGLGSKVAAGAGKAFSSLRKLAYLIPGLGIVGIMSLLAEGVAALWEEFKKGNGALDAFKKNVEATQEALKSSTYKDAIVTVSTLKSEVNAAKNGFLDKTKVVKHYNESIGKTMGAVSNLGQLETKLKNDAPEFIRVMFLKAKAMVAAQKAAETQIEGDAALTRDLTFMEKLKAQMTLTPEERRKAAFTFNQNVTDAYTQLGQDRFRTQLKGEADKKSKVFLDIMDKSLSEATKTTTKKGWDYFDGTLDPKKVKDNASKILAAKQRLIALQNEIADSANQFTFSDGLESEEEKIDKFFNNLIEKIEKFNRDPKNKLKLSTHGIEVNRTKAKENASYVQETKDLVDELEIRKKEYADYEEYKKVVGEEVANKQYAELVTKHKTYLERLKAEEKTLYDKGGLTKLENARYKQVQDLRLKTEREIKSGITDEKRKEVENRIKAEENAYRDILDKSKDFFQQKKNLDEDYQLQLAGLERNKTKTTEEEYDRQKKLIEDNYKETLKELEFSNADIFKKLNKDISRASAGQLIALQKELENVIKSGKIKNGVGELVDIPPETLTRIVQAYDNIKGIVSESVKLKVQSSNFGAVAQGLQDIGSALQGIGTGLDGAGFDGSIIGNIGNMVVSLSDSFTKINTAAQTFKKVLSETGSSTSALKSLGQSKDWIAAILQLINVIISMFGAFKKYKESLAQLQREVNEKNADIYLSEYKISQELREQNRLQAEGIELTLKQLEARKKVLEASKSQVQQDYDKLFKQIQNGEFITGRYIEESTWLGKQFGSKAKEIVGYGSLTGYNPDDILNRLKGESNKIIKGYLQLFKEKGEMGMVPENLLGDFINSLMVSESERNELQSILEELDKTGKRVIVTYEKLDTLDKKGLLDGATKKMFDQLKSLKEQGADVDKMIKDLEDHSNEVFTATASNTILDSIVNGFKAGKRSVADFADTFEELMRDAMLNSLKYEYLQAPLQEWYKEFAEKAKDGIIDSAEKEILNRSYNDIIAKGDEAAKMLEQTIGLSATKTDAKNKNSLSGAYAQASQESIDLLAGQTMAFKVAQLQTNVHLGSIEQIGNRALVWAEQTANNTYRTASILDAILLKMNNNANNALAAGI